MGEEMADDMADLREDMDMTTFDETSDLYSGKDKIVQFLLESVTPVVSKLATALPESLCKIQLRALAALNNIAWTMDSAVALRPRLAQKWNSHVKSIWRHVIAPVLSGNTADIALADAVTGVAWPLAKAATGKVDLLAGTSGALHKSFISLYQAAPSDDLRSKCVGVLGCLAMDQAHIDVNKVCRGNRAPALRRETVRG